MDLTPHQPAPAKGAVSIERELVSGVHFFIVADLIIFAALFGGFMMERWENIELFNQSSLALNAWIGILNTLILVTSGLLVVLAIGAARNADAKMTRAWLVLAWVVGAGFGVSKVMEYSDKFDHGINMLTNDFYMFYFALTGAHFLHFIGGMVALAVMWLRAGREPVEGKYFATLEAVGLYWHMVDLLWILIFPLLYLLGVS